jgi:hypothetical protein
MIRWLQENSTYGLLLLQTVGYVYTYLTGKRIQVTITDSSQGGTRQ